MPEIYTYIILLHLHKCHFNLQGANVTFLGMIAQLSVLKSTSFKHSNLPITWMVSCFSQRSHWFSVAERVTSC